MPGDHRRAEARPRLFAKLRRPDVNIWRSVELHRLISVLLVLAAPALGLALARSKDPRLVAGLLVGQLVVAGLTWWLGEGRAKRIEQERIEAAQEMLVGVSDALEPTVNKLGEFVRENKAGRKALRSGMIATVLAAACGLGSEEARARACYFKLMTTDRMEHADSRGRAGQAKARFAAGTPEGDAALTMIRTGGMLFCDDVKENPPPGWVQSERGEYQTFVSVTVQCGGEPFGMLTLDALAPGSLTKEDGEMLRVLGHILGIVESMSV